MRRRLLLLAGVLFVAWAAVAALWFVRLASDLQAGRDAASEARDHLGPEQVADQVPLRPLKIAEARFRSAHERAGGWVLAPLRFMPVVGRQLRSIEALSGAAEDVARAGVDAVTKAGRVFDHPAGAGIKRVEQVRELGSLVDGMATELAAVKDLGPLQGLLSPLADARNELASELADARRSLADARAGSRAALSLVGGPRRYLVVAANNAEMRGGSGMWLQGGVLVTRDGKLTLEKMSPLRLDADPPDGAVVPTGDLESRWGYLRPGDEWRNLMLSPRFEDNARLASQMWAAAGRGEVDGVIAIDAVGLQAIVEATGPVTVGDTTVGANDVLQAVLHDQYLALGAAGSQESQTHAERREALAVLAKSAIDAIDRGDYPASRLIRTLGDAIRGRHVLAWSTDPVEQDGWEAAGMTGSLTSDSLLVSVLNRGGNKLDWFLHTDASLSVQPGSNGWEVTVKITLSNETPAGEPSYIAGPHPGLALDPGEYRGILTVNVPADARGSKFDGVDELAVAGADGPTRVVGFQLDLPRGEQRTVYLHFVLPSVDDHLVVQPSARVPGIAWRYRADHWEEAGPYTAIW